MKSESRDDRGLQVEQFRKVCRENGIKVTPQRLEVFLEILGATDHPSAEEVFRRVRRKLPMISLDTVYRTLTTFDELGLIATLRSLEDRSRFDPNTREHHHVVCTGCKRVMDIFWPEIDALSMPPQVEDWGRVETKHVLLRGTCSTCLLKIESEAD